MISSMKSCARKSRTTWLVIAALAVIGGSLFWGASAPTVPPTTVIFLIAILACPLMHLLMHRQGGHGGRALAEARAENDREPSSRNR